MRDLKHRRALHDLDGPLVLVPQVLEPPLARHADHREEDEAPSGQAEQVVQRKIRYADHRGEARPSSGLMRFSFF